MGRNRNKPLIELDKPRGKVRAYWASARAASDHYGINVVNISQNVNGVTRQAKGHYFRYATPAEIEQYTEILKKSDKQEPVTTPVTEVNEEENHGPASTLPDVIEATEDQSNSQSAFARLLEESKKKFKSNSE